MDEMRTWTAQEIATATKTTDRTVQRRAKNEGWPYVSQKCRGGRKKVFAHSGLPVQIQAALLKKYAPKKSAPAPKKGDICSEVLHEVFDRKNENLKSKAAKRLDAVLAYHALVKNGALKTVAKAEIAQVYGISEVSLYRWVRMCEGLDKGDWLAALAPGYVGRRKEAEMDPMAWEVFKADYLRNEQPTLSSCYERLTRTAEKKGWIIPSMATFNRAVSKKIPHSVVVFCRQGDKALEALYPPQKRDKSMLTAGKWINGDGYKHNVFVRWPDGHIERPKTWFWQDVYSNMIMAWRTDMTEHTDMIRLAFLDLCDLYGIPEDVTLDNTRGAANKVMSGGIAHRFRFKVRHEEPLGLFPQLGVKVHWAIPGHGQSKPVERAFGVGMIGEYVDKDPALAGAYCGNNPNAKPENYGSKAIPLAEFMEALRRGVHIINSIEKRKTDVCGGVLSYEQAFMESYAKSKPKKITPTQRRKLMLCAEEVSVGKGGVITMKAGAGFGVGKNRYWSQKVVDLGYGGKKVVVRFDPQNLHADVHVYTLDGKYIDAAACQMAAGFGDTEAAREHNRARAQYKKAKKAAAKATKKMDALEVAAMLPDTPDGPDLPDAKVVELQFAQAARAVGQDFEPEIDFDAEDAFSKGVKLKIANEENF